MRQLIIQLILQLILCLYLTISFKSIISDHKKVIQFQQLRDRLWEFLIYLHAIILEYKIKQKQNCKKLTLRFTLERYLGLFC